MSFRRSKRPKPFKTKGDGSWSLKKADREFSRRIRERDKRCLFPGCQVTDFNKLQASHYFGRANKAVRFDYDNVDAFCWFHHYKSKMFGMEYQKQTIEKQGWDGQYTLFKKKQLGDKRWNALCERAKISIKVKEAIKKFQHGS